MIKEVEILIYAVILLSSYPIGKFLARLCSDELRKDRKYFLITLYSLAGILVLLTLFYYNLSIALSLIYMIIVMFIMLKRI